MIVNGDHLLSFKTVVLVMIQLFAECENTLYINWELNCVIIAVIVAVMLHTVKQNAHVHTHLIYNLFSVVTSERLYGLTVNK